MFFDSDLNQQKNVCTPGMSQRGSHATCKFLCSAHVAWLSPTACIHVLLPEVFRYANTANPLPKAPPLFVSNLMSPNPPFHS